VTTVPLPPLSIAMSWHRRVHGDAGVKALREALLGFVGEDRRLRDERGTLQSNRRRRRRSLA